MGRAVDNLVVKLTTVKAHTALRDGKLVAVKLYERKTKFGTVAVHDISRQRDIKAIHKELDAQGVPELHPMRAVAPHPIDTHVAIARNHDGKIIGATSFTHNKSRYGKSMDIHDVRVMNEEKKQGVGHEMLRAVAEHTLAQKDGDKHEIAVHGAIRSAVPFYEKNGASFVHSHQSYNATELHPSSIGTWSPDEVKKLAVGKPTDRRREPTKKEKELGRMET